MEKITTVGIDLAKAVFSLHGVDRTGRMVLRRTVRRDQLVKVVAGLSPCLIGMEACSGAHDGAAVPGVGAHGAADGAEVRWLPYRRASAISRDGQEATLHGSGVESRSLVAAGLSSAAAADRSDRRRTRASIPRAHQRSSPG